MRASIRLLLTTTIVASFVALSGSPAAACSCAHATDQEYLDRADVVFLGELVEYEYVDDPDGDGESFSGDPAVWTFAVHEVFKGAVTQTQRVLSAVSGASCGLEIPRQGTFLVFASEGDHLEFHDLAASELSANLCGGTRSVDAGPLDVETTSSPPAPDPTPVAAPPPDEPPPDDSGVVAIVGFFIVGLLAVGVAVTLARRARAD